MSGSAASAANYRGRFAPSPTGPLHFGSLIAAVASYLQAGAQQGEWLVRIEDIDPTREIPGATDSILRSLDAHGFEYAQPTYQSDRLDTYAAITEQLLADGSAYRCSCSRKEIHAVATQGPTGVIYPGTCRNGADTSVRPATSIRVRTTSNPLTFTDALQGELSCNPETAIGDFLIRRGDGLVAYQLAVVADDEAQQITEVVRGTDLLESTFMQIWLQRLLDYRQPAYMHFPVATGADGQKLSKQTGAPEVNDNQASNNLFEALKWLGQQPENGLKTAPVKDLWGWAAKNWDPSVLRGTRSRPMGV
jgi:glutamyl-Q tRNA(Asp) synthetase